MTVPVRSWDGRLTDSHRQAAYFAYQLHTDVIDHFEAEARGREREGGDFIGVGNPREFLSLDCRLESVTGKIADVKILD